MAAIEASSVTGLQGAGAARGQATMARDTQCAKHVDSYIRGETNMQIYRSHIIPPVLYPLGPWEAQDDVQRKIPGGTGLDRPSQAQPSPELGRSNDHRVTWSFDRWKTDRFDVPGHRPSRPDCPVGRWDLHGTSIGPCMGPAFFHE